MCKAFRIASPTREALPHAEAGHLTRISKLAGYLQNDYIRCSKKREPTKTIDRYLDGVAVAEGIERATFRSRRQNQICREYSRCPQGVSQKKIVRPNGQTQRYKNCGDRNGHP